MTQLSKLWDMAFNHYVESEAWASRDYLIEMEQTLLYWWTRASCEKLKGCYNHLQQKIKARERLPK